MFRIGAKIVFATVLLMAALHYGDANALTCMQEYPDGVYPPGDLCDPDNPNYGNPTIIFPNRNAIVLPEKGVTQTKGIIDWGRAIEQGRVLKWPIPGCNPTFCDPPPDFAELLRTFNSNADVLRNYYGLGTLRGIGASKF